MTLEAHDPGLGYMIPPFINDELVGPTAFPKELPSTDKYTLAGDKGHPKRGHSKPRERMRCYGNLAIRRHRSIGFDL